MSAFKWIGATLGWSLGGPLGAILGLALGSLGDAFSDKEKTFTIGDGQQKSRRSQRSRASQNNTQPGDFEVSLLVLASIIIKADGVQDQRELDVVRSQFVKMYGKDRANNAFKLFKSISTQNVSVRQICMQIQQRMDHASRLQLVHFLFDIAKADGHVHEKEEDQIHSIASYLNINARDYESLKAMFYSASNNAYKILEIEDSASIDQIKKAYRRMAKKFHPDKVEHLGEEHKKGAEAKFKEVLKAYEQLQDERGF
ncbi:TerB family tellurite resistance protein [Aurantibacter sp.]|uniref:TerB family tellurite resistance protein n=1 Tax=Aurantibacter sp. TaxID=2807103 RepID=UPI0035C8611B